MLDWAADQRAISTRDHILFWLEASIRQNRVNRDLCGDCCTGTDKNGELRIRAKETEIETAYTKTRVREYEHASGKKDYLGLKGNCNEIE